MGMLNSITLPVLLGMFLVPRLQSADLGHSNAGTSDALPSTSLQFSELKSHANAHHGPLVCRVRSREVHDTTLHHSREVHLTTQDMHYPHYRSRTSSTRAYNCRDKAPAMPPIAHSATCRSHSGPHITLLQPTAAAARPSQAAALPHALSASHQQGY